MEESIKKYCNEICIDCVHKENCRSIEHIVIIKDGRTSSIICNSYERKE